MNSHNFISVTKATHCAGMQLSRGLQTCAMALALLFGSSGASTAADQGTLTLFGADRTEPAEKGMTAAGLAVIDRALQSLGDAKGDGTGDAFKLCVPLDSACQIQVRWISDVSYAPSELVADITLPKIDQPSNAFDGNGKRRKYAEVQQRIAELSRGLRDLHAASPNPRGTRRTDLFGFLAAAAEYFAQPATTKVLVYVSDLEDNEHFRITPDLGGVDVRIYAVAWRADPVAMLRLQSKWRKFLTEKCHARSVAFLPLPIAPHTQ